MDINKIQKGLVEWLWLEPNNVKSFGSIDNICRKLYEQHFHLRDPKMAKYEILYRCLKYGTVEFYGNNKYGLSPTCSLVKDKFVLFNNFPSGVKENMNSLCLYDNNLGIEVYEASDTMMSFIREKKIPNSEFDIRQALGEFSSLNTIVNSWEDETIIDFTNYLFFNSSNTWESISPKPVKGVYRKAREVYAQRIIMLTEGKWKSIPGMEKNIDAFNIAVSWSQVQNKTDMEIIYNTKETKLLINSIFFPIIIERLLFLNTILVRNCKIDVLKREYFIEKNDFSILNKMFDYQIKVV